MKVVKNLIVANGKYTTADGQEKTRWLTIGKVLKSEKGTKIKIDSVPVADWNGWVEMVDPRTDDAPKAAPAKAAAVAEDDLPF